MNSVSALFKSVGCVLLVANFVSFAGSSPQPSSKSNNLLGLDLGGLGDLLNLNNLGLSIGGSKAGKSSSGSIISSGTDMVGSMTNKTSQYATCSMDSIELIVTLWTEECTDKDTSEQCMKKMCDESCQQSCSSCLGILEVVTQLLKGIKIALNLGLINENGILQSSDSSTNVLQAVLKLLDMEKLL